MGDRYWLVKLPPDEWASIRFTDSGAWVKAENHGTVEVTELTADQIAALPPTRKEGE